MAQIGIISLAARSQEHRRETSPAAASERRGQPMPIKITLAVVAALLTVASVNATAQAQSHLVKRQMHFKAKGASGTFGGQHSEGIAIYDDTGQQTGFYRGGILGYGGTSCDVLTAGGFVHVCRYDGYN
jgi:hypothetical protein